MSGVGRGHLDHELLEVDDLVAGMLSAPKSSRDGFHVIVCGEPSRKTQKWCRRASDRALDRFGGVSCQVSFFSNALARLQEIGDRFLNVKEHGQ